MAGTRSRTGRRRSRVVVLPKWIAHVVAGLTALTTVLCIVGVAVPTWRTFHVNVPKVISGDVDQGVWRVCYSTDGSSAQKCSSLHRTYSVGPLREVISPSDYNKIQATQAFTLLSLASLVVAVVVSVWSVCKAPDDVRFSRYWSLSLCAGGLLGLVACGCFGGYLAQYNSGAKCSQCGSAFTLFIVGSVSSLAVSAISFWLHVQKVQAAKVRQANAPRLLEPIGESGEDDESFY